VPVGDGGDRDDRAEPHDTGRRHAVGESAVVGLADHARMTVVPGCGHRQVVLVVAGHPPVQPVDDGLHAGDVPGAAVHGASGGEPGAVHVGEDHRVAAWHEVV